MRFVIGLGFGENRKIGVRTHLTYRDILVRRMRDRLGGDYEDAVLLRVLLRGTVDGKPKTLVREMVERYDESHRHPTAMMRATAIPTVVAATLIADETQVVGGGADVMEDVVPRDIFLDAVSARGLRIEDEWLDGHAEVTAKKQLQKA
jgi:saccharopine dehydrogenase-like NADP-dependent oxidoreductase